MVYGCASSRVNGLVGVDISGDQQDPFIIIFIQICFSGLFAALI